jgi:hypothetical protein
MTGGHAFGCCCFGCAGSFPPSYGNLGAVANVYSEVDPEAVASGVQAGASLVGSFLDWRTQRIASKTSSTAIYDVPVAPVVVATPAQGATNANAWAWGLGAIALAAGLAIVVYTVAKR